MSRREQDFRRTVLWDVFAVQSGIYFADNLRSADKCRTHHDKSLCREHTSKYLQSRKCENAHTPYIYVHPCICQRHKIISISDYCYCNSLTRNILFRKNKFGSSNRRVYNAEIFSESLPTFRGIQVSSSSESCSSKWMLLLLLDIKRQIWGAVKKFPELWYNTVMVGHTKTLT